MLVDERGVEWEVFDESTWSLSLAMEFDYQPQSENPGLVFISRAGRKRLWPRPAEWQSLGERHLLDLLTRAKRVD